MLEVIKIHFYGSSSSSDIEMAYNASQLTDFLFLGYVMLKFV